MFICIAVHGIHTYITMNIHANIHAHIHAHIHGIFMQYTHTESPTHTLQSVFVLTPHQIKGLRFTLTGASVGNTYTFYIDTVVAM